MNKALTIILILLLSIITIGLAVGLYFMINNNFNFKKFENINFDNVSKKLIEEKEITTLKDLNIKTNVVDISIEENDTNTIKVELYSDDPSNYEITEENDKIRVVLEEKKKVGFYLFKKVPKVKIYMPSNYDKNISVNSSAGDVKIAGFPNATLNAKLDVGDLKIKSIKNATTNLRVGDIKIEKIDNLTSELKTGDIKIQYVNEIVAKIKTGDIKIDTVNNFIDITSTTGDIKIENLTINKNSKINSKVGDVKIKNTSGCYINAKTRVGDNNINNNDRKSDIELTITNDVGDIKVN